MACLLAGDRASLGKGNALYLSLTATQRGLKAEQFVMLGGSTHELHSACQGQRRLTVTGCSIGACQAFEGTGASTILNQL